MYIYFFFGSTYFILQNALRTPHTLQYARFYRMGWHPSPNEVMCACEEKHLKRKPLQLHEPQSAPKFTERSG